MERQKKWVVLIWVIIMGAGFMVTSGQAVADNDLEAIDKVGKWAYGVEGYEKEQEAFRAHYGGLSEADRDAYIQKIVAEKQAKTKDLVDEVGSWVYGADYQNVRESFRKTYGEQLNHLGKDGFNTMLQDEVVPRMEAYSSLDEAEKKAFREDVLKEFIESHEAF